MMGVYDKIVTNAPACHCEPAEGWRGNLNPGLLRDCFVGVRLLAMTSFLILTRHLLIVHTMMALRGRFFLTNTRSQRMVTMHRQTAVSSTNGRPVVAGY